MTGLINFKLSNEVLAAVNIDYLRPATAQSHGDDRLKLVATDGIIEVREEKIFLINSKAKGLRLKARQSADQNQIIYL